MKIETKKILAASAVNFILCLLIFGVYEFVCFKTEYNEIKTRFAEVNKFWREKNNTDKDAVKAEYRIMKKLTLEKLNNAVQHKEGSIKEKRPAVFAGCSFAEGLELEPDERIHSVISEITGRETYSLSAAGTSINWIYKRLKEDDGSVNLNNPEYFIYIYIPDHIRRLFAYETLIDISNARYTVKNGRLKEAPPFIDYIYPLFSVKKAARNIAENNRRKELKNGYPLFNRLLEETKKILDNKYDNPKFVLLAYPELKNDYLFSEEEIKRIKKMGIIYINAEELAGHKISGNENYYAGDKIHPNAAIWRELAPKLAERLHLRD